MPDRDIVHKGLRPRYQAPYKLICADAPSLSIVRSLMKPVKCDLVEYGDGPVHLIEHVSDLAVELGKQDSEDWLGIHTQIERLARAEGNTGKRGMNIVKHALKETINQVRFGQRLDNFNLQAYRNYIWGIVNSNFIERAPRIPFHHNGIDHLTFRGRLEDLRVQITKPVDQLAQSLAKSKTVAKTRLPRMERPRIDLDTNLHSIMRGSSRWNR